MEAAYPKATQTKYRLRDCLTMGLSLFNLKSPLLCQCPNPHDHAQREVFSGVLQDQRQQRARENIQALYEWDLIPTDTTFRQRLDEIHTSCFDEVFRALFQWVDDQQLWPEFEVAEGRVLVAVDGTGVFSSRSIHCDHCRIIRHRDDSRTYSHQVVTAAIVHPTNSSSLPFGVEPIGRADGAKKTDCEQEAAKRLLRRLRESHPNLGMVIWGNALYSTGPMVQLLQELNMEFLTTTTPARYLRLSC